jgi:hypothetical protein
MSTVGAPRAAAGDAFGYEATVSWSGTELLVYGGYDFENEAHGFRYDVATDTWAPMAHAGDPCRRYSPTSVWTGSELLVWGGARYVGDCAKSVSSVGWRYTPASDSWKPMTEVNQPPWREQPQAVWTGEEMIVWGGNDFGSTGGTRSGGRYGS